MATWIDVTAPENWADVQIVDGPDLFVSDCGTASATTIDLRCDPYGSITEPGVGLHPRVERAASGPTYAWAGSRWIPSDYMPDPTGELGLPPPLLEYVGPLTGIQRVRVTAELHSEQTVGGTNQVYLPEGAWPPGLFCSLEPVVLLAPQAGGWTDGTYPVATEFVKESAFPSTFVSAVFGNGDGEIGRLNVLELMDITKIEMYADADGDFWGDFIDLLET